MKASASSISCYLVHHYTIVTHPFTPGPLPPSQGPLPHIYPRDYQTSIVDTQKVTLLGIRNYIQDLYKMKIPYLWVTN